MKCFRCNQDFPELFSLEYEEDKFCKSCSHSWNKIKFNVLYAWKYEKYWNSESPYNGVLFRDIPQEELKRIYEQIDESIKSCEDLDLYKNTPVIEQNKYMLEHLQQYIIT